MTWHVSAQNTSQGVPTVCRCNIQPSTVLSKCLNPVVAFAIPIVLASSNAICLPALSHHLQVSDPLGDRLSKQLARPGLLVAMLEDLDEH